jgi:hypothetical protein
MRWLPWVIGAIIVLFLLSRLSTCSDTANKSATAPPAQAPTAMAPAPAAPAPAATTPPASPPPAAAAASGLPANVYFDVGSTALSDDAKKAITGAADAAKQSGGNVELTGYTDKTGDAAKNEELAKNRAVAVQGRARRRGPRRIRDLDEAACVRHRRRQRQRGASRGNHEGAVIPIPGRCAAPRSARMRAN